MDPMVRATKTIGCSRRTSEESVQVVVAFYAYQDLRCAATTGVNRRLAPLLRACTHPGWAHVNVIHGEWIYESHWRYGFTLGPATEYPISPRARIKLRLPSLGYTPEEWGAVRFTLVRAVLDCLYLPRLWTVHSCVSRTAGLLGVRRVTRRPQELYQALLDGDYGYVGPVLDAQAESSAAQ
jgi:hypothetical protein